MPSPLRSQLVSTPVGGALVLAAMFAASTIAGAQRGGGASGGGDVTPPSPRPMVTSTTGMVVSVNGIASDVGAAILKKGGNAVDAAVATAFALAVVHPAAGNIGGGGFMVIRSPSGASISIDYRETAPAASTKSMYLDAAGKIDIRLTNTGYIAPGVPGTVRGLALAHQKYGKLPWKDDVMPAVDLAEKGFVLSPALSRSLAGEVSRGMAPYAASVKAYGKPGGGTWAAGDTIVLKDLGRTLRAIAENGPDAFYTGWIADSIAASMKAGGGLITKRDLAAYQAKARTPIRTSYNGYEVIGMPPPSSGGVTVALMLNILENFDLKDYGRTNPETEHLMIEAMRRAYLDRARYLGDPDFVKMPLDRLTSKEYAKGLAKGIDLYKASSSAELGKDILTQTQAYESDQTNHFSIIDKDGMAVSNTFTLEGSFGSHVVASGTGFILNNEMGDFNKRPGFTDSTGTIGTPANQIAPGKRMLSSMDPTIVTKDGQLFLVTGSPGSRTIINTVFDIVLNATTFGMNVRQAVDFPRLDSEWMPDVATFERTAMSDTTVVKALQAMGHVIRSGGVQGDAHSIMFDPKTKTAFGAADGRSPDSKASIPW